MFNASPCQTERHFRVFIAEKDIFLPRVRHIRILHKGNRV